MIGSHRESWRISARSTILLACACAGVIAAIAVSILASVRAYEGTWTLVAAALGIVSFLGLIAFVLIWPEIRRVASSEQSAAVRRIASILSSRESVAHQVLNSVELSIRKASEGDSQQITVMSYLNGTASIEYRSSVIVGARGSGKSTLISRLALNIASVTASGQGSFWPLYLSARSWNGREHLSSWIEAEMASTFRVRRRVTSAWIHSGRSVMLLDDLDEVSSDALRLQLLQSVHDWQRRPYGGKVVVTANSDQLDEVTMKLRTDRIISIQPVGAPVSDELMRQILEDARVFSSFSTPSRIDHQVDFLRRMTKQGGSSPLLVRAIEKTIGNSFTEQDRLASGWTALLDEADAEVPRNWLGAINLYERVAETADNSVAAIALMRATLVQAAMGEVADASARFDRALTLFRDINSFIVSVDHRSGLGINEEQVLNIIGNRRGLLEEEIIVRSSLAPSEVRVALQNLIRSGYAYVREVGSSRAKFYESAVIDRSDALVHSTPDGSQSRSQSS